MDVNGRRIGVGNPCFIIAEVGSNHNCDLKLALELIDAAAAAGADAVKFQLFKGERHYSRRTPPFEYLVKQGIQRNIVDLLKELELPVEWLAKLKAHARKRRILFFSSVTSCEDVDFLDKINIPLYKLASFEIVDLPLIKYMAQKGRPMILSTGLCTIGEIEDAYLTCREAGNTQLAFLQCASVYPAQPQIMNLKVMRTIGEAFQVPVGLSDHTLGIHIALAAVAMGACIIEKHFTLSCKLKGPDHSFAIEPLELKSMVSQIRDIESALGSGIKGGASVDEQEMFEKARRSIHACIKIPINTKITESMLTVKRPGYGIKPKFLDLVVGRKARVTIEEDEAVLWDMV